MFTRIDGVSAVGLVPAEGDPLPAVGTIVQARLDDVRRRQLMRTHSGLHVVCGVVFRDFGALVTGSNMEPLLGRMDFNLPEVPPSFKEDLDRVVNEEIARDRPILDRVVSREEAMADPDVMRTAQELIPPEIDEIRVIDVDGLDKQADAGTHVASTPTDRRGADRQGREQGQRISTGADRSLGVTPRHAVTGDPTGGGRTHAPRLLQHLWRKPQAGRASTSEPETGWCSMPTADNRPEPAPPATSP